MHHNDFLFAINGPQFTFLRRFEDMYSNCEDPHGQSKELGRLDYQIVAGLVSKLVQGVGRTGRAARILDVGCGLGYFTAQVQTLFPEAQVSGCDISTTAVAKAAANAPACTFFSMDLKDRASLPARTYDVLMALHMLCYFTEDEIGDVVGNLNSLTEPGGYVVVGHHLPKQMRFGRFMQDIDGARALFGSRGFTLRVTMDLTNDLDVTYAGDAVGRSIYFLAQKDSPR